MIGFRDESTPAKFGARLQTVSALVYADTAGGIDPDRGMKMYTFRIAAPSAS
jgi:hypothetical protein